MSHSFILGLLLVSLGDLAGSPKSKRTLGWSILDMGGLVLKGGGNCLGGPWWGVSPHPPHIWKPWPHVMFSLFGHCHWHGYWLAGVTLLIASEACLLPGFSAFLWGWIIVCVGGAGIVRAHLPGPACLLVTAARNNFLAKRKSKSLF